MFRSISNSCVLVCFREAVAGEQKTNMDLGPVFANMVGGKVFERGLKNLTRTDGMPMLLSSKSYRFSIYIIDYTGSNAFAENLLI